MYVKSFQTVLEVVMEGRILRKIRNLQDQMLVSYCWGHNFIKMILYIYRFNEKRATRTPNYLFQVILSGSSHWSYVKEQLQ
jgi:hypothetical protein